MPDWEAVAAKLAAATGEPFALSRVRLVGGGCINDGAVLESGSRRYFVKHNARSRLDMFSAEAEGLHALRAAHAVRAPAPICWGTNEGSAFLVLEYLELSAPRASSQAKLGAQLARLHRLAQPQFGWHRDNTIGSTPQINAYTSGWPEFFRDRRLGFQLDLAGRNGYGRLAARGERLLAGVGGLLRGHAPQPSLLHGDLWLGNAAQTAAGEPVIFDPAVYYGDREADLAMTALFGGFADSFYRAYLQEWPLPAGHEIRRTLYNLYHVLNHLNLFGRGYLGQAEGMVEQLLAEMS